MSQSTFIPFQNYLNDINKCQDGRSQIFPSKYITCSFATQVADLTVLKQKITDFNTQLRNTIKDLNIANKTDQELYTTIKRLSWQFVHTIVNNTKSVTLGDINFLSHELVGGDVYSDIYLLVDKNNKQTSFTLAELPADNLLEKSLGFDNNVSILKELPSNILNFHCLVVYYNLYAYNSKNAELKPVCIEIPAGVVFLNTNIDVDFTNSAIAQTGNSWGARICSRILNTELTTDVNVNVDPQNIHEYKTLGTVITEFGKIASEIQGLLKHKENITPETLRLVPADIKAYLEDFKNQSAVNVPYVKDGYWFLNGKKLDKLIDYTVLENIVHDNLENILKNTNDPKFRGPQGIKGDRGERGEKGDIGLRGERGEKGEKGAKGDKGEKGEQGIQGERGEKGEQGIQGIPGTNGLNGKDGTQIDIFGVSEGVVYTINGTVYGWIPQSSNDTKPQNSYSGNIQFVNNGSSSNIKTPYYWKYNQTTKKWELLSYYFRDYHGSTIKSDIQFLDQSIVCNTDAVWFAHENVHKGTNPTTKHQETDIHKSLYRYGSYLMNEKVHDNGRLIYDADIVLYLRGKRGKEAIDTEFTVRTYILNKIFSPYYNGGFNWFLALNGKRDFTFPIKINFMNGHINIFYMEVLKWTTQADTGYKYPETYIMWGNCEFFTYPAPNNLCRKSYHITGNICLDRRIDGGVGIYVGYTRPSCQYYRNYLYGLNMPTSSVPDTVMSKANIYVNDWEGTFSSYTG